MEKQGSASDRGLLNLGSLNRNKENSFSPITIKIYEKGRVGQEPRVKLNESPPFCEIIIVIPHTDYGGSLPLNYSNQ